MTASVNGKALLPSEITLQYLGAWHADVTADSETPLTGKVTIDVDGAKFLGTVIPGRSGLHGGRIAARIVGGNGGLSKEIAVADYAAPSGTKVSTIVADILRDCGEKLSATSDKALLGQTLPKWHRIAGPANHALTRLTEELGAVWRVLPSGEVWVGLPTWTEVNPTHELIDEDWANGIVTIATETPSLEPGTTFRGQRVDTVVHVLTSTSLRTMVHANSPGSALNKFLGYIRRQIDYSRKYPARVVKQNSDGTLQLVPDDARVKGPGLDRARCRLGLPGSSVKVPAGQRVMLGWDGGDPALPYASDWDQNGAVLEISIAGGKLPAARQGDMTATTLLLVPAVGPAGPIPGVFCISVPPGTKPPPFTPTGGPATFYGIVTSGNPLIKE